MGKSKELVIDGEGRTKATLGVREEVVEMEVVMDAMRKDRFEDLAEHRGEANWTVGGGIRGGFVRFKEHEDLGDFPQAGIVTGVEDGVIEGCQGGEEGERAFTEVAVGDSVVARGSVAFSAECQL